jgi:hypothetical protein
VLHAMLRALQSQLLLLWLPPLLLRTAAQQRSEGRHPCRRKRQTQRVSTAWAYN